MESDLEKLVKQWIDENDVEWDDYDTSRVAFRELDFDDDNEQDNEDLYDQLQGKKGKIRKD